MQPKKGEIVSEGGSFETAVLELIEHNQRRDDARRAFAREAARTYADVLDDLFFYYVESIRAAECGTREG